MDRFDRFDYRQIDAATSNQKYRDADRQAGRQTDRQTDRERERERERQTEREREREGRQRERERGVCTHCPIQAFYQRFGLSFEK